MSGPAVCPAGHTSASTDYCDTCGLAIDDAGRTGQLPLTPPAEPAPADPADAADAAAPAAGLCPHCQTANAATALFCENCGYDFTTGALPRPLDPPAGVTPTPSTPSAPAGTAAPEPAPPVQNANPAPPPADAWVAEIWIDPDWYADQQSTDPLPSPGLPIVQRLEHTSLLVGRASRSRGIAPDIDLGTDTGISRRHCQITTDGTRWFVEDLGSSNGTYVGGASGTLPTTPVPVGRKTEVGPDDRIYLGAWTRIVIRKAAPGEV